MSENGRANGYTAQQFITAIPGTGGVVSAIANRVGCAWHTAKKYIDNYPTVNRAWRNERYKVNDMARVNIITAIKNGDMQMSKLMSWPIRYRDDGKQEEDVTSDGQRITTEPDLDALAEALASLKPGECSEGCGGCES